MKTVFFFLAMISSSLVYPDDVPTTPPNACYSDCTPKMQTLLDEFENVAKLPSQKPTVYSGVCNHNGMYNPHHDHHAVVLLDQVKGQWNFSAILSFFAEQNDYADWNLEDARREMNPDWLKYGKIASSDETARVVYRDQDGTPVYVYWMRQNRLTNELLLIVYSGTVMRSFCRLLPHPS